MSAFFGSVKEAFGAIDILVNNAGTAGPTAPIEEIDATAWRSTLDVNVFGTYLSTRFAVPLLRAARGGAIINMSSAAGHLGFPLRTPYAVAKWGIVGLTKSLSIELGPNDIRVNAIMPGMVGGPRMDSVITARAEHFSRSFEAQKQLMLERVAMGTLVEASDIAEMAVFLASASGRMVSGQAIGVDAGLVSLA
jgi:NAD(P)-dependent dehydrogenase (short-subunit alcohol dehydrogenase family)